jgi:hypothetical protein
LAVVAMLAGCSSDDKAEHVCPRVAVLSEAGYLTRYRAGSGRDILDIDFDAEVRDLISECAFTTDKGARRVTTQVAPVFVVTRGAANTDRHATFTYFVSVVRNEQILSKQTYALSADFAENRSRVIITDDNPPISIDIPLPYRGAEREYEVILGFQLTPEELRDNQRPRGFGR